MVYRGIKDRNCHYLVWKRRIYKGLIVLPVAGGDG